MTDQTIINSDGTSIVEGKAAFEMEPAVIRDALLNFNLTPAHEHEIREILKQRESSK